MSLQHSTPTTNPAEPSAILPPLCVDLDGTLVRADTLHEALVLLLKRRVWRILQVLFWLMRGRAFMKKRVAEAAPIEVSKLPVAEDFLSFLREEHARGRMLILATGADESVARKVAEHFGIFREVMASDGIVNLTGHRKVARLVERFGTGKFDYAGNSCADRPIWSAAQTCILVNPPARLATKTCRKHVGAKVFGEPRGFFITWCRALRLHQWAKNVLVLLPVIAGHKLGDMHVLWQTSLAAAAFCLCASSVYLINDLEDLESDRLHPTKRRRPFAAGDLLPGHGVCMAMALLAGGVGLGFLLPPMFLLYLAIYYFVSILYSWVIKKQMLIDVFALAGLYTLRILAGHGATGIRYSSWLLGFSMFLFLSLALLKRYIELHRANLSGRRSAAGRNYATTDLPILMCLGPLSGWLAALVLSLYISSEDVRLLYAHPLRLLLICPLLLYWISRVWMLAGRDALHDDPVMFALKDRTSYLIAFLAGLLIWLGTI